jgi:hypothetical protein
MLFEVLVAFSQPSVRVNLLQLKKQRVMGLIDNFRRTLELTEIEERLQALENT